MFAKISTLLAVSVFGLAGASFGATTTASQDCVAYLPPIIIQVPTMPVQPVRPIQPLNPILTPSLPILQNPTPAPLPVRCQGAVAAASVGVLAVSGDDSGCVPIHGTKPGQYIPPTHPTSNGGIA